MRSRCGCREAGNGGGSRAGGGLPTSKLCNEFLSYLADRRYSPASVRGYAFDLLPFARWLAGREVGLAAWTTDVVVRYLAACRAGACAGREAT